jgi:hypothetical protein
MRFRNWPGSNSDESDSHCAMKLSWSLVMISSGTLIVPDC